MNWVCPYCNSHQILNEDENSQWTYTKSLTEMSLHKAIGLHVNTIACLNLECKKLSLSIFLVDAIENEWGYSNSSKLAPSKIIKKWDLLPESNFKPQPDCIPEHIKKDYKEACLIKNLSPNASVVLARRCLEGILKDLFELEERTLHLSIEKLKKNVKEDIVTKGDLDTIDAIRKKGRIGAHMKLQTNEMSPQDVASVSHEEADAIVGLLEMLLENWYVVKHNREEKSKRLLSKVGTQQIKKHSDET